MPKPNTIVQVIRRVENWPEVFSMKLGLGARELSLISLRDGLKVACRRRSADWDVVRSLLLTGCYQRSTEYLRRVREPATVLDLGGNIGCFSLLAVSQNPLIRVRAYEPGSPNIRMFRLNCLANPAAAARIELFEEAVGGTNHQARWHFDAANPGGSSLYGNGSSGETIQVRAFRDIVDAVPGPIALVKIDIEGAEYELFEATPSETWSKVTALTIELHPDPTGRSGSAAIQAQLGALGFQVEADDRYAWFCHR